jgi:hypothetical protein
VRYTMRDRRAEDMVALGECGLRCPKEGNAARGVRHSDVNTKVDFGSCSRCSDCSARSSSPRIGCVLGVPFLTLRTCTVAVLRST